MVSLAYHLAESSEPEVAIAPLVTHSAAAGNAPDIQYLWNGIYHMESVWLGYLQALNGLVSDAVIEEVLQRSPLDRHPIGERERLYFEAMMRVLDRVNPGYAD